MSLSIGQSSPASAAVGSSTPTSGTAAAGSSASSASLATEQTFLTLLVAQLSNQDPLQPAQGTDFVTQLAQFAQVEQSENQTSQLQTMSGQLSGMSNSATTQLVGQTVTIQGNTVSSNGSIATPSSVTLSAPAAAVTATISNSSGVAVRTIQLGSRPAGVVAVNWDGHEDSGVSAPAGTYSVSVTATDSTGAPVGVTQSVTGVVQSVSFAQGYAELTLASGAQAPISQLVSVGAAPQPTSP
jgi:flagellar basal-body rod modification protein FlgD